jgi:hypothetical protein
MRSAKLAEDRNSNNGPTDEMISDVVDLIEGEASKLLAEKMEYMRRCKPIHEHINDIIDDAVAAKQFNKKALKIKLKQRAYERKARDLEDDIDGEVERALTRYSESLGDFGSLPLGQAAVDGFKKAAKKGNPLDGLAA